ncbi:CBS domain-containing protein [Halorarius litoreus]|uniref:CBS domain-containing protein n=1 Tax=Halorarius litoreus TaxID=2962676 RepID=UPI0020CF5CFA|nr:CBS domain-containing protein [Halorarius litoreus]
MPAPLSVRNYMTTDVATVTPEATVRTVAQRLSEARIGSLVVVDGKTPVGVVTESDLTRLVAGGGDPSATYVSDVMTEDPVTVGPDTTLAAAATLLVEGSFRRLPVLDGGDLVGIITASDLVEAVPGLQGPGALELLAGRADTAYETPDWEFESEGVEQLGIGDRVKFRKTLSDSDVREFAHASGDTNRLHLDESFAADTRFKRRIVHGTLVAGVISSALARLPGLTIYLGQDLRYLGPVDLGDRVTAVCEIVENLGDSRYRLSTAVYDSDEECVIEGEATVLIDALPEGEIAARD